MATTTASRSSWAIEAELQVVRRDLDSLNSLRLSGPLDPRLADNYGELCREENELLRRMTDSQ